MATTTTTPKMSPEERDERDRAALMVKNVKDRIGRSAWRMLGPELREAVVAREILFSNYLICPKSYEDKVTLAEPNRVSRLALEMISAEEEK